MATGLVGDLFPACRAPGAPGTIRLKVEGGSCLCGPGRLAAARRLDPHPLPGLLRHRDLVAGLQKTRRVVVRARTAVATTISGAPSQARS